MTKLYQVILTAALVIITITNGIVATNVEEDKFTLPEKEKFPSIIPSHLKVGEELYDNLLAHLTDQLSAENVDINDSGLFPTGNITCSIEQLLRLILLIFVYVCVL